MYRSFISAGEKRKMERKIYDHVAVLGVDGMGNFNREAKTPNLDRIFENGATTFSALSMNPTISAENWGAMLLGAVPLVHGLTNTSVSQEEYTNTDLPSIFTLIRRRFPDAYLASCCNWDPINFGIIEHDVGVEMFTADDEALTETIIDCVKKKPKFLFVQFDGCDGAGHHFGYGTEGHIRQIETTDGYIGRVFDAYEEAGILEKTLFVVTADHGGFGHGHGGYTDGEKYVFLGASGKGIEKSEIAFARTIDIAAIVLFSLGVELPRFDFDGFSSQIPNGLFPWYSGEYILPEEAEGFEHGHSETPNPNGENGLFAYFKKEEIKTAVFFDDKIVDSAGNFDFREEGSVKFYWDAPLSACGELGETGFFFSEKPLLGRDPYTISLFMKTDQSIQGGAYVLGGKTGDYSLELYLNGFNADVILNGGGRSDGFMVPFEGKADGSWVHYLISVDLEKAEIGIYTDFTLRRKRKLTDKVVDARDDFSLFVGTGPARKRNISDRPCIFRIDDLIVFSKALDESDVEKLKEYYGV